MTCLRVHCGNAELASRDLKAFYGAVTRTKIARSLRRIGFGHRQAFDMASDSVVDIGGRRCLPFGYVQSTLLATLALEHSLLGRFLVSAGNYGVRASVYVDDMIVSAPSTEAIETFMTLLDDAAVKSGFAFNPSKSANSHGSIQSFNILLTGNELRITDERMQLLRIKCASANPNVFAGVKKYVNAVNQKQVSQL